MKNRQTVSCLSFTLCKWFPYPPLTAVFSCIIPKSARSTALCSQSFMQSHRLSVDQVSNETRRKVWIVCRKMSWHPCPNSKPHTWIVTSVVFTEYGLLLLIMTFITLRNVYKQGNQEAATYSSLFAKYVIQDQRSSLSREQVSIIPVHPDVHM